LVGSSRLSERQIRLLINSFANRMSVKASAKHAGVSHVTVGRIFNLIRKRLLALGRFFTADDVEWLLQKKYKVGVLSLDGEWKTDLAVRMRRHRKLGKKVRPLYEAEEVFWLAFPKATAKGLEKDIRSTIRMVGPLGKDSYSAMLRYAKTDRPELYEYRYEMLEKWGR
jgi:hypothetical protein